MLEFAYFLARYVLLFTFYVNFDKIVLIKKYGVFMKLRKKLINSHMLSVIWLLAWPTMLEQLMQTAVQYIDTAMVGTLGTDATAAVGSTTTINWLVNSSISALGIGFLSFISRSLGAGEKEKARRASAQSVLAVLVVGLLFTVICTALSSVIPKWMQVDDAIRPMASRYFLILYTPMLFRAASTIFGMVLRSAGDTKTPMKISVGVNIINVVGNYLLIPVLGVLGAAIASAFAFMVGGIWIFIVLWNHKEISPKGYHISPDIEILAPCMRVALPNMLQRFATSFGYVAFASMVNALGSLSTAAHTIANTVESFFYIPGYGMQTAAATLAGNAYGANDKERMKELGKMFLPLELCLMMLSGGALFATAPLLVDIFSDSPEVIRLGSTVLRMVALSEPFYGISIIIEGMMQGVGQTRLPFLFNILGMWGVRIVGTFICTQMFTGGLISAWACMIAHNMLLFVLFLICFLSGRWNPLADKYKKPRDN